MATGTISLRDSGKYAIFLFDPGESERPLHPQPYVVARFAGSQLVNSRSCGNCANRQLPGKTGSDAPLMPLWQLRAITRALAPRHFNYLSSTRPLLPLTHPSPPSSCSSTLPFTGTYPLPQLDSPPPASVGCCSARYARIYDRGVL